MNAKNAMLVSLFVFPLAASLSAASPDIYLISPADGHVSHNSYIEITCNATDDMALSSLGLYTNIDGSFGLYGIEAFGELGFGLGHTMLCHLNGNYSCWNTDESSQTNLTHSGVSFGQGKIRDGARVGQGGYMKFQTSSILSSYSGSAEFWVRPMSSISGTRWLFMMGESDADLTNQIRLYINQSGQLVFEWYDDYGDKSYTYADVSWWENDTWYHVAIVWDYDNNNMDLFINGSNSTTQGPYMSGAYYPSWTPSYAYIGSKFDASGQLDAVYDELIFFDSVLTGSDVLEHYMTGLGNQSNASATWNVTGLPDGEYVWNCRAVNNQSIEAWGGSNYTFHIDRMTPPSISSVSHSPEDEDELDPGIQINVTANITDPSGVDAALLQYRRESQSSWINVSMGNISETWNGSFIASAPHDTWYYRIWANDSIGNAGNSSIYSVMVDYDYTWSVDTHQFGTTYAYIETEVTLGTVSISNTGDYPLSFSISSTYTNTEYNVSDPESFDVPSMSNISIEVNATAPNIPYEYHINITLDAISGNAQPSLEIINATLISYVGGPHLVVDITSAPSSVNQSQSGINISATVKNIGNETATETWLNLTLPSGFSLTEGNASQYIGNLSQGASQSSTVTVSISPAGAMAGGAMIYANASCSENTSDSDSAVVIVSCSSTDGVCGLGCSYSTDSDCPRGGGGGTSGGTTIIGGGGAITDYGVNITIPYRIDINRGENKSFTVLIRFDQTFTADHITLDMEGYPLTYISVYPERFDGVNYGDTLIFTVSVYAPPYIRTGEYDIVVRVSGHGRIVNATISASDGMILYVHSTGNETSIFDNARNAARRMIEAGLSQNEVQQLLESMDSLAERWDYDAARDVAEKILETAETAFMARDMLMEIKADIDKAKEAGIGTPETEKLYKIALAAFQRGDYERALERINNARASFGLETYGMLWLLAMLRENQLMLIILVVTSAALSFAAKKHARIRGIRKRMGMLEAEKRSIQEMIIRMQRDYFGKGAKIGADSYSKAIEEYESKLAEIEQNISRLRMELGSGRTAYRLKKHGMEIRELMKELQVRYFRKGDISRGLYESGMRRMREELADIERNIDALKKKASCGFPVAVIIFALISGVVIMAAAKADAGAEQARQEIANANNAISDMMKRGLGTSYANDTLNEAMIMLRRGEYAASIALAREVWDIRDAAFNADRLIDEVEEEMYSALSEGLNMSGVQDMLREGIRLFESENYLDSVDVLTQARDMIEEKRTQAAMKQSIEAAPGERLARLVVSQWPLIIAIVVAACASFIALRILREKARLRGMLESMRKERESIRRAVARVQHRYFKENAMGRLDYETIIENYRKRLVMLDKDIYAMEQRLGI